MNYVPLTELVSEIIDNRGKTCPTAPEGIPLIATNCLRNDALYPSYETIRYVSEDTYETWFRGHPKPGDLIFVTKGSPGRVCVAPDPVDFCIAQDMVALRADKSIVYPKYLFAVLRSEYSQKAIENMHVGTLIPHFKKGDFHKLKLPVPDKNRQILVGDVYYELSQKIELNRRMNATLEAMARALFKAWFVDFEPVHANRENRPSTSASPEIAKLFPPTFENSLPKGWEIKSMAEVIDVGIGKTPPRKEQQWFSENPNDVRWVSIKDMGATGMYARETSEYLTEEAVRKFNIRMVPDNSVLLSFKLTVGRVCIADGQCTTNEAIAHFVRRAGSQINPYFLYSYLRAFDYSSLGSTSSIATAVNSKTIRDMPILYPAEKVLAKFEKTISPIFERLKNNSRENKKLSDIRDSLLPRLINGKICVES